MVRVFSPNATYAAARAAVNGANIIVYIGHGSGYPNPYSGTLQTAWNNGWGLNRDRRRGRLRPDRTWAHDRRITPIDGVLR